MSALRHWRLALLIAAATGIAAAILFFPDWAADLFGWVNQDKITLMTRQAGIWGPVLIVTLMLAAVVFSPIPSAPIALAAGATYGHYLGAVYVVIGAEAGALIAFGLARKLGRNTIRKWFGDKLSPIKLLGSQGVLMWAVFVSRLMPFVSFDLVSYAAGLSNLAFWRFALATLAGIIPASFLLAHFGGEMANGKFGNAAWIALGLGIMTGASLLWAIRQGKKKRSGHFTSETGDSS